MKKRVLSLLLAVVLIVGMMPTMVLTASAETDPELSEWMKSLPDTVPISEINMPGTHDSGTAYMYKAQDTGSCQGMTIPEQLDFGIRVLDIRVDGEDGDTNYEKAMDMTVNHGGFDASVSGGMTSDYMRFKHVLQYVETFLKDHPSETVVMYVSAEGGDSDDAKRILWNFVQDYHHTAKAAPCTEGEWIYNFVRCYEPGEEVPRLGEVRGKAVMLLDNGENDAKTIPAMRSFSSYEMAYEWKDDLKKDISNKVTRVEHLFTDAEENGWKIRQGIDDIGRWPIFIPESYRNMTNIGNPDIKYSGTNVTDITGAWSAISTETVGLYDGPKGLAEKFWDAAKADNILQYIIPGYRYGWITMDFPEMYPEFTEAIVRSNCIGEVHTNRVYVTGIPEVSEEDIIFDVCACYSTPSITYEYKEGTDKVIGAELVFPSQWNMERKDIDHAYAVSVSVKKGGQAFVGILKEPTVDSTTYINGVPWCEASGTIRMEEAPDTVQSSVKVVFDDGPENYDLRPKSLKEFQTMIGHTSWGGYYSGTDSVDSPETISRVPFIPEAATENSLQGNCLIGFTQDPGSDNTFTLTAQFPAHCEDGGDIFDEFRLENMVGILPDCPYSCTIAADERTLVLTLENYRGIGVIGYLEYNADEDSYDRHFCRSYGIFGGGSALGDGWYLVKGNVNCPNGLTIGGNVSLILEEDCTLSVTRGLTVNAGSSLTVYAQSTGEHMGRIYADSSNKQSPSGGDITFIPITDEYKIDEHCSGIGGSYGCDCGNITIHGGKITALGGFGSAGIGGGCKGSGGELTVYGGEITAIGGYGAAGIGGGFKLYGEYGEGGELRIVRGSITATAGACASNAIGGGNKAPAAETVRVPNGTSLRDNVSGEVIERGFDQTPWSELLVGTSLSFTAENASSESPVRYRYYNEDSAAFVNGICRTYTLLNRNMRSLSDGWYVLAESGTMEDLAVSGDVHLILKDDSSLTVNGLCVNEGYSLAIYAQSEDESKMGVLNSYGENLCAGIGSAISSQAGNITIHGGKITAQGGRMAAGIGGGALYGCGNIKIHGGIVNAESTAYGAGIGSGMADYDYSYEYDEYEGDIIELLSYGNNGTIEITGGTVNAVGNGMGAGIGGGEGFDAGTIIISGGTVTALGGDEGYGIGNGRFEYTIDDTYRDIGEIPGGTVELKDGNITAIGKQLSPDGVGSIVADTVKVSPATSNICISVKEISSDIEGSPFSEEKEISDLLHGLSVTVSSETPHSFTSNIYRDNGDGTHSRKCTECDKYGETQNHDKITDTYTWSIDNDNCTVTRTCETCSGTILSEYTENISLIEELPGKDCMSMGTKRLRATFENAEPGEITVDTTYGPHTDADNDDWCEICGEFIASCNIVSESTTELTEGKWLVQSDISLDKALIINGNVTLYLYDGCTLNATKGIVLTEGNTLTIYARPNSDNMGKIVSAGRMGCAGIGGYTDTMNEKNIHAGTLVINGGDITATGGIGAAGIGGGYCGNGDSFTMNGGSVTAISGGYNSRAIGAGGDSSVDGTISVADDLIIRGGSNADSLAVISAVGTENYIKIAPCDHIHDQEVADAKFLKSAATCTEVAVYYKSCSCGEASDTDTFISGTALGHKLTKTDAKAATCTEKGWAAYETCSRCDYSTFKGYITGSHNYAAKIIDPTCTAQGYTVYTCSDCGNSYKETIKATGHKDADQNGYCDACGFDMHSETDNCSHLCHKSGFLGFIWKIVNFFYKLFRINQYCACGKAHW